MCTKLPSCFSLPLTSTQFSLQLSREIKVQASSSAVSCVRWLCIPHTCAEPKSFVHHAVTICSGHLATPLSETSIIPSISQLPLCKHLHLC